MNKYNINENSIKSIIWILINVRLKIMLYYLHRRKLSLIRVNSYIIPIMPNIEYSYLVIYSVLVYFYIFIICPITKLII